MEGIFFDKQKNNLKMFLVIYDIVEDKHRKRFAKLMEGYGKRVQRSAFECYISIAKYETLIKQIPNYITSKDSIRVYPMYAEDTVIQWGTTQIQTKCDVWIV